MAARQNVIILSRESPLPEAATKMVRKPEACFVHEDKTGLNEGSLQLKPLPNAMTRPFVPYGHRIVLTLGKYSESMSFRKGV